ncbi:MAG: hypothetical protein PHH14_00645 [Candidatus Margulisbacteria bacterium]|nr:hypothetical protein [Candidatus Margulisiibacteriota bacterium]
MDIFDSRYISKERIKSVMDGLTTVKNYLKNFNQPVNELVEESKSIRGALSILGLFQVPGSGQVVKKIETIENLARDISRDMNNINLDRQINDLFELYLKMDSLNAYIKELENRR